MQGLDEVYPFRERSDCMGQLTALTLPTGCALRFSRLLFGSCPFLPVIERWQGATTYEKDQRGPPATAGAKMSVRDAPDTNRGSPGLA